MSGSTKRKTETTKNSEETKLIKLIQLTKSNDALVTNNSQTPDKSDGQNQKLKNEIELLDWFGSIYQSERKFAQHKHRARFVELFTNLIKFRLTHTDWPQRNTYDLISRCLICLRILIRDSNFQRKIVEIGGISSLTEQYRIAAEYYLSQTDNCYLVDVLSNISLMLRKLATTESNKSILIGNDVHQITTSLLDATDTFILQCALLILLDLSSNPKICDYIASLSYVVEKLVRIIEEYDNNSRVHAANLLRGFCSNRKICEQLIIFDCLPVLLSVLHHGDQCVLLLHIVWILVLLCKDPQHVKDIRSLGGIPLLLNLLQDDRTLTVERHEVTSANMRTGRTQPVLTARSASGDATPDSEALEQILKLKSVCCTALSELSLDNAQTVVEGNGVYIIAKLILPEDLPSSCTSSALHLQLNAFRALRFLFSMERNRRLFKRLFPSEMFQTFIDIGHYVRSQDSYQPLVDALNKLGEESLENVIENIEELNQNRKPRRFIKGIYAVMDLLGSGAFGSVYKVKKENEEKALALKEVSIFVGGKEKGGKSRQKRRELDEIVRELTIIKEQLRHPNVVRYYKTFQENDRLYIEMELIEGASLQEHFNALIEKKQNGMEADRVWRVLIQLCLALRYLHKEKNIVHRDLTPGNIMLGENDHVTITDFGLAKQKQDESKLYSVVGTLLYSCPEIIKSEPYGEKADIWALGCILYQMTTLKPPFPSDNMLSLAKKIVEARFENVPGTSEYVSQINFAVTKCLTVEPEHRPDIVEVVSLIAAPMLRYTDNVTKLYHKSERKLEKERRRTQRNYHEAKRNMENYRSLFKASQESNNRIYRNFSMSNAHTFTQQEKFSSFNPNVSSPAIFTPVTPPNGHQRQQSGEATSPGSDVFSEASSSGYASLMDAFPSDAKQPHPPRSRPNSAKNQSIKKQDLPCRALSFDMSEQGTTKDSSLSRVGTASRGRPGSASNAGTLTISPRKVRQINDPVQTMLHQLHKIIFIDQLPPTSEVNFCRRIISRYKRALFSPQSTSVHLKTELKKLLSGSQDYIDAFPMNDASSLARQATAEVAAKELPGNGVNSVTSSPSTTGEEGVTYSQMYSMIEKVLCECGYYDVTRVL
uniref:serine/threonine-protein kinase Nek10-like n=1 Tax=Styela clava TaxID=7725 RepID=UPI001939D40F|nr:serine/threonine-protein kinase Nek10-like [Styela clava]